MNKKIKLFLKIIIVATTLFIIKHLLKPKQLFDEWFV